MDNSSGVGVVDKSALLLRALEAGPTDLAGLVARTGLPRPTAHRLAVALEFHRLVARDHAGRFELGPRLLELASAIGEDKLVAAARPVLNSLCASTGESAQLYQRRQDDRVCVAAAELTSGLRDTVPVGSTLPMRAGSAAQVLLAWEPTSVIDLAVEDARFSKGDLNAVRRRGWAQSIAEREAGVASVSAPVFGPSGNVIAAISVSGPIERLTRSPGKLHSGRVTEAAEVLSRAFTSA